MEGRKTCLQRVGSSAPAVVLLYMGGMFAAVATTLRFAYASEGVLAWSIVFYSFLFLSAVCSSGRLIWWVRYAALYEEALATQTPLHMANRTLLVGAILAFVQVVLFVAHEVRSAPAVHLVTATYILGALTTACSTFGVSQHLLVVYRVVLVFRAANNMHFIKEDKGEDHTEAGLVRAALSHRTQRRNTKAEGYVLDVKKNLKTRRRMKASTKETWIVRRVLLGVVFLDLGVLVTATAFRTKAHFDGFINSAVLLHGVVILGIAIAGNAASQEVRQWTTNVPKGETSETVQTTIKLGRGLGALLTRCTLVLLGVSLCVLVSFGLQWSVAVKLWLLQVTQLAEGSCLWLICYTLQHNASIKGKNFLAFQERSLLYHAQKTKQDRARRAGLSVRQPAPKGIVQTATDAVGTSDSRPSETSASEEQSRLVP